MVDGIARGTDDLLAPATNVGPEPLESFYRRYRAELRAYVMRAFGIGPPEPDDVVQTAFMKFASLSGDSRVGNPRAFLYATARNIVLDHHRRTRVAETHAREVQLTTLDGCYEISPERILLDKERVGLLVEALAQMPLRRRRMVLMNRFNNLTCEAIGRRLGVSTSTVQKQVVQGIADCLRKLGENNKRGNDQRGKGTGKGK